MGDVNIIIKDGHIVGVDGEEGDDSDLGAISGSGENELDISTTTDSSSYLTPTSNNTAQKVNHLGLPTFYPSPDSSSYLTPTSNNTAQKVNTPKEATLLPYIVAAAAAVVVLVLIVIVILWCRRRRRRRQSPSKKSSSDPVVYNKPYGHSEAVGGEEYMVPIPLPCGEPPSNSGRVVYSPNGCGGEGEGYSVAIPLTAGEPPLEEAPPPPVPASAPPRPPGLSASGGSTSTRYTPLGGRKGVSAEPMPGPKDNEKCSIYESIDDNQVANVYEEAAPAVPKSNSGRRPQRLSSLVDDPNMGSEKDKMLPPGTPV